jgi:hypothetical protein
MNCPAVRKWPPGSAFSPKLTELIKITCTGT